MGFIPFHCESTSFGKIGIAISRSSHPERKIQKNSWNLLTNAIVYDILLQVSLCVYMPVWRNGRRARLKIVRETVGVQVPSPAPFIIKPFKKSLIYKLYLICLEVQSTMAKCEICSKATTFGIQVSHSHRRSNRTWKPNVKKVRAIVDGAPKRITVCSKCLKSGRVIRAI